jgi:membrane protease YdiL (CAAX protease family)
MPALAQYLLVTFGWTWTLWWIAVLAGRSSVEGSLLLLFVLGGLGPAIGAFSVIRRSEPAYRREFVRRLCDPTRISRVWWLALAAVSIVPAVAGYLAAAAAGRPPIAETTFTFSAVAFTVGFGLAAGAVEEPGWRGVALDLLGSRTAPAVAAILIGLPWALWHLPLFFLEGTYQHALGFGSTRFWLFNFFLLLLSVLYVWLCNGSRGSILIAVLAHAGTNVAGSLIPQDVVSDVYRMIVTLLAVIIIVWLTRGNLSLHEDGAGHPPVLGVPRRLDATHRGWRDSFAGRGMVKIHLQQDPMHHRLLILMALLAGLFPETPLLAQASPAASRDAREQYRVYAPPGEVRGALALLPGYGGDANSFDPGSGFTPSTLPARLAERGILTLVAVPARQTLYESEEVLQALDVLLTDVLRQHRVPPERVAIGGFSVGGTGAVRYAQFCAQQKCRAVSQVAAVFAVDAPLDFERLYRTSELIVARNAPRSNLAEEQMLLRTLRTALGGTPEEAPEAYRRNSAVLASAADGGNARLLGSMPMRLYTEPDVQWWMRERNLDFQAMNSVDHATLINLLRIGGNDRAELITTTGKGFRPNGARHPHSWSIVDEPDLVQWLLVTLFPHTRL